MLKNVPLLKPSFFTFFLKMKISPISRDAFHQGGVNTWTNNSQSQLMEWENGQWITITSRKKDLFQLLSDLWRWHGPHPGEGEGSERQPFEHHQLCPWAVHRNNETEMYFSQKKSFSAVFCSYLETCFLSRVLCISPQICPCLLWYTRIYGIYIEKGKNRQFSLKQAFNLLQAARIMTAHIVQGHLFLALHSNYVSGKTEKILKLKSWEINLFQKKGLEFHFNFFASWGAIQISY